MKKKSPALGSAGRGWKELVLAVAGSIVLARVVDRLLEGASVDQERDDDLQEPEDEEYDEFRRSVHVQKIEPSRQHEQEEAEDPEDQHRDDLPGVVDAGLRDSQEFEEGRAGAKDIDHFDPCAGVGALHEFRREEYGPHIRGGYFDDGVDDEDDECVRKSPK